MNSFLQGFLRYKKRKLPGLSPLFKELAKGQNPKGLFFTCSDSRVDPNLVTSSNPGDIFIHRSVGNLIPPCDRHGVSRGDVSEASAIEFALEVLGIKDVVILGHSMCGAMQAVKDGLPDESLTPNLKQWLLFGKPALARIGEMPQENWNDLDRLTQANVVVQLENMMTYPSIKKRLADKSINVHGAWFEVATGDVFYYETEAKRFVPIGTRPEERG